MYDDTCRFLAEHFSAFLKYPGLLPFAALGQSESPEGILRQVTEAVDRIEDLEVQANLMGASAILAGLRLKEHVIQTLVRRDIMKESVIYQSIQRENTEKIALNFLREGLSIDIVARGTGLSLEAVQKLQQQLNEPAQS